ncbi:BREX-1 system adenine-specific DNA-methyltransferase PglX [Alicyclobacillus tolerans]|uniref:BREX-1 system adenine-specific DNA-methyltransferase PglX n=1 Tax=Alicyclobacillus tolerans TaxID=90970 RepID=UPI003B818C38
MNKTALKNFATSARKELLKKVEARALKIGITEEGIKKAQLESSDTIYIDGKQLSLTEKKQRDKLIQRIREIGFKNVIEEVAYTWFNRFIALRFMEVNNYLPTKVRVLSSSEPGNPEPDIIKEALSVELDIDKELVYDLKLNNNTEELFKYMVIKQCNDLNKYLPFMFETIEDYKEILFPEGLLAKESFLRAMTDVKTIPESDWKTIEIIGWLYQFYISEEKARVFKAKKKYKTEEIPFATQLFTPDWIVRYLVQNSLGRYWVESHPEHADLADGWEFYIEDSNSEAKFEDKNTSWLNRELKVEDIKCFDPAMGSGHILVYAFEVLFEIYRKCGYMEREIPRLIIENNLYGLDIDDRAYQLACFSVVMKALQYNGRFLREILRKGLALNLASIQQTNCLSDEDVACIAGEDSGVNFARVKAFIEQFRDAKIFGSLINIHEVDCDLDFLEERLKMLQNTPANDLFENQVQIRVSKLLPDLLKQSKIMIHQFDVVIMNPPYMGNKSMNAELSNFMREKYPISGTDTCTAFMEVSMYLKPFGFLAMINQHSWMFTSTFEDLRRKIISNMTIVSMLHLGAKAFDETGGEVVQSTAFVLRNCFIENFKAPYIRLVDLNDPDEKRQMALAVIKNRQKDFFFSSTVNVYTRLAGSPVAYWIGDKLINVIAQNKPLGDFVELKSGMSTGDNSRFQREWFEVNLEGIGFGYNSVHETKSGKHKWFPCNSGGEYRKWYGNNEIVVNWRNDGEEIRGYRGEDGRLKSAPRNTEYYFREGLTWTKISTGKFAVRYKEQGFAFDDTGRSAFTHDSILTKLVLGLLCSKFSLEVLKVYNPTMSFTNGDIHRIPFFRDKIFGCADLIIPIVNENINISRSDWDSFEVSWGFKRHPLLVQNNSKTVQEAFEEWDGVCKRRFYALRSNEEELNKIFIHIYDLDGELSPHVNDEDITIKRSDKERDIKSFISYAVGCMFGRYSLDQEGLVFAGGTFDPERYKTFAADSDNILPIISDAYFEDDIVSRFVEFVKVTFGEETLTKNLEFIADSLGRKDSETPREAIRRYFLNDFFKEHLQTYKKKPIYWLFTSGKQKAFNCLIYMHRYDKTTLSRIRTDYLHELQMRYDAEKKSLLSVIEGGGTAREISAAKKELKTLELKIAELKEYEELLHHMSDMQIEIDLDDGVDVNYAKFEGLLAKRG